jgi:hypothetical protein
LGPAKAGLTAVVCARVLSRQTIGNPSDAREDFSAEELNATEPVIYRDESARIDALRARVREARVKRVARVTIGVSLSTIQRFVTHGTKIPRFETCTNRGSASDPQRIMVAAKVL